MKGISDKAKKNLVLIMALQNNNNNQSFDEYITSSIEHANKHQISPLVRSKSVHVPSERYETLPIREMHETFLRDVFETIVSTAVFTGIQRENKVLEWHQPDELAKLFDMSLKAESDTDAKLLELIRNTIQYSVKTGHPYFVNQLFSSVDVYALAGQWLTDALNPSVYTYVNILILHSLLCSTLKSG